MTDITIEEIRENLADYDDADINTLKHDAAVYYLEQNAPAIAELVIKQAEKIERFRDASADALTAISYQEELIEILEPAAKRSVVEVRELRKQLQECVEALEVALIKFSDTREVWFGSDGFVTETITEAYLEGLCKDMADEATKGYNIAKETLNRIKGE